MSPTGIWLKSGTRPVKMASPGKSRGWRSVSTPDILVWQGKYYLYYQAYTQMPGRPGTSATNGNDCPVACSVADSPDGPWAPYNQIVIPNRPEPRYQRTRNEGASGSPPTGCLLPTKLERAAARADSSCPPNH